MTRFHLGSATEAEIEDRRHTTLKYLAHIVMPENSELSPKLVEYMRAVRDYPDMKATRRDEVLGVRGGAGVRPRKKLKALQLMGERLVSPGGHGNNYTELYLTDRGLKLLSQLETEWKESV